MIFILIAVIWLSLGFVSAGYTYASFQRKYPELSDEGRTFDMVTALFDIVLGPLGFMGTLYAFGGIRYGWLMPGRKP